MKYGVQFRDMHTAIHNVAVFTHQAEARSFLLSVRSDNLWPDFATNCARLVEVIEINFRDVPSKYKGENLRIMNGWLDLPCGAPNLYWG